MYHVNKQSAYLFGRDRIVSPVCLRLLTRLADSLADPLFCPQQVADIPVDHPSTSKQHAVLQFRQVMERSEFGDTKTLTKCVAKWPLWAPRIALMISFQPADLS